MRIHEVIGIIREYFGLGIIGLVVLSIFFIVGYFLVYGRVLGGNKRLSIKQILIGGLLIIYIIMVIGVTFLNRGATFEGSMNLNFLSSYREAWNNFTLRGWQLIIFNMLMFAPLGFLLPLLNSRFRKIRWTMGAALGFTLLIEFTQLFTGLGIFELDDIFNNVLGAFIGYGLIMEIYTILENSRKRFIRGLGYLSPLLLVVLIFFGGFTYYNMKEFGNLAIAYNYKVNMEDAHIQINTEVSDENGIVNVYKAPSYDRDSAEEFIVDFYHNRNIDTTNLEVDQYNDNAAYWVREEPGYNIWLNYIDGSYRYSDFSTFEEGIERMAVEEEVLVDELDNFNIQIPNNAAFSAIEEGGYEWHVDKNIQGDKLMDGVISCSYYSDNTIKDIDNNLITYSKIKEVPIKSEKEVYRELSDGKFNIYLPEGNIEFIEIDNVELDYYLDSKGYYQPVYAFESIVDGNETTILIPGLK